MRKMFLASYGKIRWGYAFINPHLSHPLTQAPPEAVLQTQISNCLSWAEKQLSLDFIPDFIPPVAELVSFAAFQPVTGKSGDPCLPYFLFFTKIGNAYSNC